MGGRIKKTYQEAWELFYSKGLELLDEVYIGALFKMNCIDGEGYKLVVSFSKLQMGRTPDRFNPNNPHTIDNIHHYIKLNRENVELVSTDYNGNGKKLIFKCLIHNKEFPQTWGHFHDGSGCPICGSIRTSDVVRLSIPIIKQRMIDMGRDKEYELISDEYISSETKLIFKCLIHNKEFPMTWGNFQQGNGCPTCGLHIGENNWNWKGGITPLHNYLRNTSIIQWKRDSFKKYNYRCDITNSNKDCIIHHLHPFSSILRETMSILNLSIYQEINKYDVQELKSIEDKCLELHYKYGLGVCLTKDIHKEFHKIYGKRNGNTTKQQYEEFRLGKFNQLKL